MKRVDLIKAIEGCGCQLVRNGAKHDWYKNPEPALPSPFHGTAKSRSDWHSESFACSRIQKLTPMILEHGYGIVMNLDAAKIDDSVLALLLLGLHDGCRAWKGFDWDAMDRLYEKGYITDPRGKAKSVAFTEEGFQRAERLLEELFGKGD